MRSTRSGKHSSPRRSTGKTSAPQESKAFFDRHEEFAQQKNPIPVGEKLSAHKSSTSTIWGKKLLIESDAARSELLAEETPISGSSASGSTASFIAEHQIVLAQEINLVSDATGSSSSPVDLDATHSAAADSVVDSPDTSLSTANIISLGVLGALGVGGIAVAIAQGTKSSGGSNSSGASDSTPPQIQSLSADHATKTVTLTYNEPLDAGHLPLSSAFTVSTGGLTNTVTGVSVSGNTLVLTLANAFASGTTLSLSYTDPTSGNDANAIQDIAGNDAGGFIQGVVADGYIRGAKIYIDTNGDGIAQESEFTGVVTDANGNFFLSSALPAGTIIAVGGVNIDTGIAQTTPLIAPAGSLVINPLTTLVQATIQDAATAGLPMSVAEASARVANAFGLQLDPGVTLTSYDPLSGADGNSLAAQQAAAQIATVIAAAAQTDNTRADSIQKKMAQLVRQGSAVDLSDNTTLVSILTDDLHSANSVATLVSDLASANSVIQSATDFSTISQSQSAILDNQSPATAYVISAKRYSDTTPELTVLLTSLGKNDGTAPVVGDQVQLTIESSSSNYHQQLAPVTLTKAMLDKGSLSISVPVALVDGSYTASVSVIDHVSHVSTGMNGYSTAQFLVDTNAPQILNVQVATTGASVNGVFHVGDVIMVRVTFDEPIVVSSTPEITLSLGGMPVSAAFARVDRDGVTAEFEYTIRESGVSGFAIPDNALVFRNGQIRDDVGALANPDQPGIGQRGFVFTFGSNHQAVDSNHSFLVRENGQVSGQLFQVALNQKPQSEVVLYLQSSNPTEGLLRIGDHGAPADAKGTISLIFTPGNWDTPQSFEVMAQDDGVVDPGAAFGIYAKSVSLDPLFDQLYYENGGKAISAETPNIVTVHSLINDDILSDLPLDLSANPAVSLSSVPVMAQAMLTSSSVSSSRIPDVSGLRLVNGNQPFDLMNALESRNTLKHPDDPDLAVDITLWSEGDDVLLNGEMNNVVTYRFTKDNWNEALSYVISKSDFGFDDRNDNYIYMVCSYTDATGSGPYSGPIGQMFLDQLNATYAKFYVSTAQAPSIPTISDRALNSNEVIKTLDAYVSMLTSQIDAGHIPLVDTFSADTLAKIKQSVHSFLVNNQYLLADDLADGTFHQVISDTVRFTQKLDAGLGLGSAFGFDLNADANLTLGYSLTLDGGFDPSNGLYLNDSTLTQGNLIGGSGFTANLGLDVAGNASGHLGPLTITATDQQRKGSNIQNDDTRLDASIILSLDQDADSKLTLTDLQEVATSSSKSMSDLMSVTCSVDGQLSLAVNANLDAMLPANSQGCLPSMSLDIYMPLNYGVTANNEPANAKTGVLYVDRSYLDLGTFVTHTVGTVLEKITPIKNAIAPIAEFLGKDLYAGGLPRQDVEHSTWDYVAHPVDTIVSEIKVGFENIVTDLINQALLEFDTNGDGTVLTIELMEGLSSLAKEIIAWSKDQPLDSTVKSIIKGIEGVIPIFDTAIAASKQVLDYYDKYTNFENTYNAYVASGANLQIDLGSSSLDFSSSTVLSVSGVGRVIDSNSADTAAQTTAKLGKFEQLLASAKAIGFDFPVLENSSAVLDFVTETTQDLVTYTAPIPDFSFDTTIQLIDLVVLLGNAFPPFKPLVEMGLPIALPISLIPKVNVDTNLSAGLDTAGLNAWYDHGMGTTTKDLALLLDGFYLSDNVVNGVDLPEVQSAIDLALRGDIQLGSKAYQLFAGAGAQIGVETLWSMDLMDGGEPNGTADGKVRVSELGNGVTLATTGDLVFSADAQLLINTAKNANYLADKISSTPWIQDVVAYALECMPTIDAKAAYAPDPIPLWNQQVVLA